MEEVNALKMRNNLGEILDRLPQKGKISCFLDEAMPEGWLD